MSSSDKSLRSAGPETYKYNHSGCYYGTYSNSRYDCNRSYVAVVPAAGVFALLGTVQTTCLTLS